MGTSFPAVLEELAASYPPCGDALLAALSPLISDEMLVSISNADYGYDNERHLQELREIRSAQRVIAPLDWEPLEVCRLIRWSNPDADSDSNEARHDGHLMRAFCCAVLLRDDNSAGLEGENQSLITLTHSSLILGADLPRSLIRFLLWRVPRVDQCDEERPFFPFALLLIMILAAPTPLSSSALESLAALVIAAEADVRKSGFTKDSESASFLGFTFHDLRHDLWREIASRAAQSCPSRPVKLLIQRVLAT